MYCVYLLSSVKCQVSVACSQCLSVTMMMLVIDNDIQYSVILTAVCVCVFFVMYLTIVTRSSLRTPSIG